MMEPASGWIKAWTADVVESKAVLLDAGAPYALGPEIALAWTGQVRVPLSGALSAAEDGAWFFRSVSLLGGTPTAPNGDTCNSCHMEGAANNIILNGHQVPAAWGSTQTAPMDGWAIRRRFRTSSSVR